MSETSKSSYYIASHAEHLTQGAKKATELREAMEPHRHENEAMGIAHAALLMREADQTYEATQYYHEHKDVIQDTAVIVAENSGVDVDFRHPDSQERAA